MKRNNSSTNKNKKSMIIITVIFIGVMLSMGTGYAVLTQVLGVGGKTNIETPDFRVYVSGVRVLNKNGALESKAPSFEDNSVGLYSNLPNKNSSITYEVTIKNIGLQDAVVDTLVPTSNNAFVKYKIMGINSLGVIKSRSNKTIKIVVEQSENSTQNNIDSSLLFDFSFVKSNGFNNNCTLTWDGTSSSVPLTYNYSGQEFYQITNANELKWFTNQVSSGNTNIKGMLRKNICLGNNSMDKIYATGTFNGIFDGQNRLISGVNFSRNKEVNEEETFNIGLFINSSGTIRNLKLDANYTNEKLVVAPHRFGVSRLEGNTNIGGIVVHNSGIIENSSFSGTINNKANLQSSCVTRGIAATDYLGGIASKNSGIIRGCVNKSNIVSTNSSVYRTCDIYDRIFNAYSGGIVGDNTGFITDSYNLGTITMSGKHESDTRSYYNGYLGTIAANNTSSCTNSYNAGSISHTAPLLGKNKLFTGAVASNTGNISNIYYLDGTATNNIGTKVLENDLKNLNNINLGNSFKKNYNASGYPLLYWE